MFNSTFLVTDLKAKFKEFNISYQENDDGGINVDDDDHVDVSNEEFSDVPINNQALDLESDWDTLNRKRKRVDLKKQKKLLKNNNFLLFVCKFEWRTLDI
ncbi:unnamed protein product [Brachionus calyciflorus]|uniref:Uncharacterized protein n=1 Tax=Brachionus calyciflorus TaxID=104777 RepID=A0A813XS85_9BILA|nr:unnamed protein product [Brachionus calyciflorus]